MTRRLTPRSGRARRLAKSIGAKAILEFGTLGGYSTIWLARAFPDDGHLITLEADSAYAAVAAANFARAGLGDVVDLRVGVALGTLPELADENAGPFDLTFIDADKEHSPEYFAWALDRTRTGGLIVADNVVRAGELADEQSADPKIRAQPARGRERADRAPGRRPRRRGRGPRRGPR